MLNRCASKGGRLTPALVGWKKQPKRQQDLDPPLKKGILAFQHENAPSQKKTKNKKTRICAFKLGKHVLTCAGRGRHHWFKYQTHDCWMHGCHMQDVEYISRILTRTNHKLYSLVHVLNTEACRTYGSIATAVAPEGIPLFLAARLWHSWWTAALAMP